MAVDSHITRHCSVLPLPWLVAPKVRPFVITAKAHHDTH